MKEESKLRSALSDILKGFSYYKDENFYIKHLTLDDYVDFECEYDFNGNWEIAQVPQNIEVGNICKQIFDIYEAAKIEKEKKLEDLKYQLRMNEINIPQYRLEENAINKKYKVSQKDIAKKLDMAVGKVNKILNEHYPTWQKNNNLWG